MHFHSHPNLRPDEIVAAAVGLASCYQTGPYAQAPGPKPQQYSPSTSFCGDGWAPCAYDAARNHTYANPNN
jgi:hypothetical protein